MTIRSRKRFSLEIIKNKCIFGFVEEKDLGEQTEMILLVDSLPVLGRWLLQYSADIEIVSPNELKEIMKKYIMELSEQFVNA